MINDLIIKGAIAPENIEIKFINENVTGTNISNNVSSNTFTRANIEALGNLVHIVDTDDENKLDMFCYLKCNIEDSDLLKQCRGVVFNDSNIVLKAFPYTIEYNHNQTQEISEIITDIENWKFYQSHEGTLLRFFYFGNKWYISTHRKLNAFQSKWSSNESFGMSFKYALISEFENNETFKNSLPAGDNIIERFQNILDKTKQYMFLIRNNKDNRIVCDPPLRPTIYHVGTFVNGNLTMDENIGIPSPPSFTFKNIDSIQ